MIIFLALKAIFKRVGAEYFQPIEQYNDNYRSFYINKLSSSFEIP
jgi:hypothetical protein